jgi:hypothetical protein
VELFGVELAQTGRTMRRRHAGACCGKYKNVELKRAKAEERGHAALSAPGTPR